MKQADAARRLGVSQSMVSRWCRGEAAPEPENCRKLAVLFGVDERAVLEMAGHLTVTGATSSHPSLSDRVEEAARRLRSIEEDYEALPVIGTAGAGRARGGDDEILWKPRRRRNLPGNRFAVEVRGDCLSPQINSGDIVIVDPDLSWRPGQIVAIRFDGAHQVKRLVEANGRIVVESNDGRFELAADEDRIVGVVVAYVHEFDW